jgi:diguanylate cyclase (GGDEF)-like protein
VRAKERVVPTDVLRRVTVAVLAALLALVAIAYTAVRATRSATAGADRVESEFAERVATDAALLAATENLDLAQLRLRSADLREAARLDARLSASDPRLAQAIGVALEPSRVRPAEVAVVRRARDAYAAYLEERSRLLRVAALASAVPRSQSAEQLRRSFAPLRTALNEYAAVHFAEANRNLRELREAGRGRNWVLVITLVFGALSLVAIALVTHGIVGRVRSYGAFARQVASGDLDTRLHPRGRDELTGLAHSLNGMVEQLSRADRERRDMESSEAAYRAAQDHFSEVLQVTESEHEAHDVLTRHLERSVPDSTAVVLNRTDGNEGLEAATPLPAGSHLREPLLAARPRSCLAVRLARTHDSRGEAPAMLECEICGGTAGDSTCVPLLVSGEVIGAVLVCHPESLEPIHERCIHESVAQAAPVLANLRTLAHAEHRAATDALTGLPNRRAAQDTFKRMLAQSARRQVPLAAIMLDLDHFKQINDTLGHEQGDHVLAAVGLALASTVRDSDFVGRIGGEEFLVLLPDTDVDAALEVAEKLRSTVCSLSVPEVGRAVTASLGVAVHPDARIDAETLLREADRALYAAKAGGRNRVELGAPIDASAGRAARAVIPPPGPDGTGDRDELSSRRRRRFSPVDLPPPYEHPSDVMEDPEAQP